MNTVHNHSMRIRLVLAPKKSGESEGLVNQGRYDFASGKHHAIWRFTAMSEPLLRFPVVCPICRQEELAVLPTACVAAALLKGTVIQLYASCHDVYWDAQSP